MNGADHEERVGRIVRVHDVEAVLDSDVQAEPRHADVK